MLYHPECFIISKPIVTTVSQKVKKADKLPIFLFAFCVIYTNICGCLLQAYQSLVLNQHIASTIIDFVCNTYACF